MDQPLSEPQSAPQITCSIHNQPACALKCVDLEAELPIKCIFCIIKEKLNGKDLISLPEIFNPNYDQISSVLPHLSDEDLRKLKKIQSDRPEDMLDTIERYFKSLKEEVITKINNQEKTSIKQVHELIEKQNELKEKHLEFSSIKELQDLISSNQNNPDLLNKQLKKYFKEFYEIQQKRQQEIQKLIKNYEQFKFRKDIFIQQKISIIHSISEVKFFQVSSQERVQEIDRISFMQQEFLELLVSSSETLSQILSRSVSLFKQNEPLDFSFIDTIIIEDSIDEKCENPKELLGQAQQQLLMSSNTNNFVKSILKILKPLTIPQRLESLSAIIQNLPIQDILNKILFKSEVSKCQFTGSLYPQSKPIQSKFNAMTKIQQIFNQGFSSLNSDCILDPQLKYKLEITFNCSQNTKEVCFIGLQPDIQKDKKLMSEFYELFSIQKQQQSQFALQAQVSLFGHQASQNADISFRNTIFICISERKFIVCDENGDIISTIPEKSIQSTTQYRIGIQFERQPNSNPFPARNQIPQGGGGMFSSGKSIRSTDVLGSQQQSQDVPSPIQMNLTIQSFQILTVFPSFCI